VSPGEDRYRRGVYTVWRRSAHYASFSNFDAPDRGACVAGRSRSNTPLQALTLMNDAVYVEMAKSFAKRIQDCEFSSLNDKLVWAFRTALARPPNKTELEQLKQSWLRESQESDSSVAYETVAMILLNLHETISKG
jgi:hypothetical protein